MTADRSVRQQTEAVRHRGRCPWVEEGEDDVDRVGETERQRDLRE